MHMLIILVYALFFYVPEGRSAATANKAFPPEIAGWSDAEKEQQREAGIEIFDGIQAAAESGVQEFTVPPGHYRITKSWNFNNFSNLTVNGSNAVLWIEDISASIFFKNCENVRFCGFTVDFDPVPYVQGEIVAINNGAMTIDLRVDEGFFPAVNLLLRGLGSPVALFDAQTRKLKPDFMKRPIVKGSVEQIDEETIRFKLSGYQNLTLTQMNYKNGDPLVIPLRRVPLFWLYDSQGVTFEHVSVYTAAGMAFRMHRCQETAFKYVNIARRPDSDRLLSICADAFHGINSHGILVENCSIEDIGDDVLNYHSYYSVVLQQKAADTLLISDTYWEMGLDQLNLAGKTVEFYDALTGKMIGSSKITAFNPIPFTPEIEQLIENLPANHFVIPSDVNTYSNQGEIQLADPITLPAGTLVGLPHYSSDFVIRSNRCMNIRSRGIIVQGRTGIIEGNRFEWMTHCPVSIGPMAAQSPANSYAESGTGGDIVISNNVMIDTSFGQTIRSDWHLQRGAITIFGIEKSGGAITNYSTRTVAIENNQIIRSGLCAVYAQSVDGLTVANNEITNPQMFDVIGTIAQPFSPDSAIMIGDAKNVTIRGNTFSLSKKTKYKLKSMGGIDFSTLDSDLPVGTTQ
ncbi:MAG: right-handed parallel beta-helix repeat-containing protein [Kiritimatiellales bacterium]